MGFKNELISWYRNHKRDLPWRNSTDAYLIWLSEIILQQTRVEQGMPYFLRFSEAYPTVKDFATASEDEILRLWQGLGYYSRGRNMLKTARKVMTDFDGTFPTAYADLITLTGVGEYTASAIASFSNNEAKAVVDGNVYRLLARYFGISTPINSTQGKKEFQALADELLNKKNAGEHNQAMIEFGALQCKPKNPNCEVCPFISSCFAYKHMQINVLPVKLKTLKIKERYFQFYIISNKKNQLIIKRRNNADIWAGLYDLPSIEFENAELSIPKPDNFTNWFKQTPIISAVSDQVKHILTHQRIFANTIEIDINAHDVIMQEGWIWVDFNELKNYGMPKLIFDFLKKIIN
ncbi:A/G-specific adenine glycosylase [Pedobacter arcticus]|uniref:A/G-specific adenine glycosylase n=1 Tax=Pedobacter arcticus TaxID=752140 RepID=UPI0002F2CBDE|nr:A/G-specific adenine glycosylase [Pedobacter arcticus]